MTVLNGEGGFLRLLALENFVWIKTFVGIQVLKKKKRNCSLFLSGVLPTMCHFLWSTLNPGSEHVFTHFNDFLKSKDFILRDLCCIAHGDKCTIHFFYIFTGKESNMYGNVCKFPPHW
jgi:hypothetical protein